MKSLSSLLKTNSSRLCIGIDPRVKLSNRIDFAKQLIKETAEYAIAFKPNIQFWHGSSRTELKQMTDLIHEYDLPVIADLKISDIGSTNRQALEAMSDFGFDYITHSPFPGNTKETASFAEDVDIGIITLVAMSNPEARWMVDTGQFIQWAEEAEMYSDGIVLGTTNHITTEIIREVSQIVKSKFVLAPGIGAQGGSIEELDHFFSDRVIYNVSRGINLAENFKQAAKQYSDFILRK